MKIPTLRGLAELAGDYDLFILDLWGVVHDGVTIYSGAENCLKSLQQRDCKVVLLSNAARPSAEIAEHLTELGIEPELYDWLLTSGQTTMESISSNATGAGESAQPRFFHLGPGRCQSTVDACKGREVDLELAEMIICTGLFDDETETPEHYRDLLTPPAARDVPMICVNPDIVVNRGGTMIPCAGAVAAFYEQLGGKVQRIGKPFPYIYERLFAKISDIPRARAVMIGDSLATDIKGARNAGIDSIWIAGGIHAQALGLSLDGQLDPTAVQSVATQAGEQPRAILPWLQW